MASANLNVNDFIALSASSLVVDVRSPIEFKKGHFPNATNVPLFDDDERAEIGTLYKLKGKDEAVQKGLELVAPKLALFVKTIKEKSTQSTVLVYCFRGGMRSNSFVWLLNTSGIQAKLMTGGYKAYRNYVLNHFTEPRNLVLLGGATGCGKTDILKQLASIHIPIVDLEGLANHKGSAFGSIHQEPQPPQQLFENHLYNSLSQFSLDTPIIMEDEANSIGYAKIPYALWLQMKQAPIIKLHMPFELRVKRLVYEYGTASPEILKHCISKISSQLGPQNTKLCIEQLSKNNLEDVAKITLAYYDKAYTFCHDKQPSKKIYTIETSTDDVLTNTQKVLSVLNELKNGKTNAIQ